MSARPTTKKPRSPRGSTSTAPAHASRSDVPARWRELFELIPGYDPIATAGEGQWFDARIADAAIAFFHEQLTFIEGDKGGEPFNLERWQQAWIGCLFGWRQWTIDTMGRKRDVRRYREGFVFVPRKNGKTPLLAGIVNYVCLCDDEPGAQVYSAAAEKDQASLVYRHAKGQLLNNPDLARGVKVYNTFRSIEYHETGAVFKVLSADADTKHGSNIHMVAIDELHAHPTRDLTDVLVTATGSRLQPLIIYITTSDYERPGSICNEKYDYACKVRDQVISDPACLPVIFEASVDDDWTSEAVWAKANPNLGVSVRLDYLQRECKKAQEVPGYENTFKRLHLNIRTQTDVRWLSLESWDACHDGKEPVTVATLEDRLKGRLCFGGMDLSTKTDVTAWVLVFPPTPDDPVYRILPRFFVPGENAIARDRRDRVPYTTWMRHGFVTFTSGNVVDYDVVKQRIADDARLFDLREIAYDPWNATQIALQLGDAGAAMVEFGQGYKSMSEPTKEFEKLVLSRLMGHGANPVLRWMVSNASIEIDPAGNVKPSKKKSTERIDGVVALVMALGRAMVSDGGRSVYEDRGLLTLG
jgi:phage terminase large subunit-like protein